MGVATPPWEPWYQALLLTLMRRKIQPDLVFAEGGNLLQLSAISRHFGRGRTLAHLHGETQASPAVDAVYGGVAAISIPPLTVASSGKAHAIASTGTSPAAS